MTEVQPEPTAPRAGPPAGGMPRWVIGALIGGILIIVALLVVVVLLLIGGDDGAGDSTTAKDKTDESAAAKTFSVKGDITLIDSGVNYAGTECYGTGGYDDMRGGTQVVVKDAAGTTVAVGALETGIKQSSVECYFPFTVDDVPSGSAVYSLEVSHRGDFSFKEEDATSISLSLG